MRGETPIAAVAEELDERLSTLELRLYSHLAGVAEEALRCEDEARGRGLASRALRARLVRADALSRGGHVRDGLALQLRVRAEAERTGDRAIRARASCLLASTYDRLGATDESLAAAELAVKLLAPSDPPSWCVEHRMVLALFSAFDGAHFTPALFDAALEEAHRHDEPTMIAAVLNNYAWTACEVVGDLELAARQADALERLLAEHPQLTPSSAQLDTLARVWLEGGRLDDAEQAIGRALDGSSTFVEPFAHAESLRTLGEVRRRRGDLAGARDSLERARATALAHAVPEAAARALRDLAAVDAELGDHARAYERLSSYVDQWERLRSEHSARHAVLLQAVYGAEAERERRMRFQELASRDPLTGLWNRRRLDEELPSLIAREAGGGRPLGLAIVDLDHFKRVNDSYSHDAGDIVLRSVAEVLERDAAGWPEGALAARLGGEEFVLVLPAADRDIGLAACERLREAVGELRWPAIDATLRVTASIGLTTATTYATSSALLGRADAALYAAKHAGRDRVAHVPAA